MTKETLPLVGAEGEEIGTGGGVVVPFEANGAPIVVIRVIGHGSLGRRRGEAFAPGSIGKCQKLLPQMLRPDPVMRSQRKCNDAQCHGGQF